MDKFIYEYWKFSGKKYNYKFSDRVSLLKSHTLKYIYFGRKAEKNKGFFRKYYNLRKKIIGIKHGLEIPSFENIQKGLLLCHAFDITVNENAVLGENVTLFKGAVIGGIRSGTKKGVPTIGNRVVIGCNAFVGGNIVIGDDVMIAPGAFVNFDVPSNSVVLGNPGVIHSKQNAADDYYTAFAIRSECEINQINEDKNEK